MNKTLLLILCDFLLLNLLALTRWEKATPTPPKQPPVPAMAANAATKDQDLVESMRQSLADEQSTRQQLTEKLSSTDAALAARQQALAALQTERSQLASEKNTLASTLTETQRTAADLSQKVAAVTQEATLTREQLAQLQRELADKQAEAERQKQAMATLEKQQADARHQIEGLTMAVVVAESEKKSLRETADSLKTQVEVERADRLKVQEATTQLAQGVGELAQNSGALTKEIRENRPIPANVLYNDFLANRVNTSFNANRRGLFGQVNKSKTTDTVFVTDGQQIYALLHIADTPFSLLEPASDWEKITVDFTHPPAAHTVASTIRFLSIDPRIMVVPVNPAQAAALGVKVYPLATDAFKFPEALLINGTGKGYGEVAFKLDASQPGYVRVDNRFFKRIFGDFAPSRGDLVFSKTGELLGMMVNSDYCALLGNFAAAQTLNTGTDVRAQGVTHMLDSLASRYQALPEKLQ